MTVKKMDSMVFDLASERVNLRLLPSRLPTMFLSRAQIKTPGKCEEEHPRGNPR